MLSSYLELPLPVRILCLGSLVNRAGSFALIFLTIYASEQLGYGVPFATGCMGVLGLGSVAGAALGGHLADQVGRRPVMLVALAGGAALLVLLGSLHHRWAFMAVVGLFALVSDMYRPAAAAMIADLVPVKSRSHAFALMYISINLGFAIAPPLGGMLAEVSFRLLFWGDAMTMALYAAIIAFSIDETLPATDSRREQEATVDESAEPAEGTHGECTDECQTFRSWDSVRRMTGDVTFLLFCISSLLMALVFMQGMSTLPIYIRQCGYTNLQFGLLMSINGIMIVILQLPMTSWLSRFEAMSVVLVGGVLIAMGFGLNAVPGGLLLMPLTIGLWTLGEIFQAPFKQSIVTSLAPQDLRARYMGMFSGCYALALMIGAPVGGEVLNRFGAPTLWIGTFLVAIAAIVLYGVIYRSVGARLRLAADA